MPVADADADPWWTGRLLKLGEDALAFERIEQMPTRGNALAQRAHDLVSEVRNGDPDARKELQIVLGLLSDQQDQPKPQKQPRGSRKASIDRMIAAAERDGKNVTSITTPDGTTLTFGPEPTEAAKPEGNELDNWMASRHARSNERH
jgi:hypothetical protein